MLKPDVHQAMMALRDVIVQKGGNPFRVDLPYIKGKSKVGLDDYIVHVISQGEKPKVAINALPRKPLFMPETLTVEQLNEIDFPEIAFVVPSLIPVGLTLLCGAPKIGKSWFVLGLLCGVAAGGKVFNFVEVSAHEVLYLALEDTERRIKDRMTKMKGPISPARLHCATEWPSVNNDGLLALERWLVEHPACKVVAIDTLAKMRPASTGRGNIYQEDYEAIAALKRIADGHGIALIVVHHTRKGGADDAMERVSGTNGLGGAADTIIIMDRERSSTKGRLQVMGRDTFDLDLAMEFDDANWRIVGSHAEVFVTGVRQEIVNCLSQSQEPLGPTEIAQLIGRKPGSITKYLKPMREDGMIEWVKPGKYILPASATKERQWKFE